MTPELLLFLAWLGMAVVAIAIWYCIHPGDSDE
jgi:hypothetical protein